MRRTQGQSQPLTWLNLLCLDAPLVAISWQQLFARSLAIRVSANAAIALFATAWLIYLVDRAADSWNLPSTAPVSLRQTFARENRTLFVTAIAIALIADATTIPTLDRSTLGTGAVVALVLAVYLAVNRFVSSLWRVLPVKEIAIGSLFAAGVFVSLGPAAHVPPALAILFAALCAMNCASIAFWERDLDIAQNRSSIATTFPSLSKLAAIACIALALLALVTSRQLPSICIAASAALLALLNSARIRIARDTRTALADVVLLTPFIALPFAS